MSEFGYTIDEMDIEAFYNIRQYVEDALKAKGASISGGGIGCGQCDLDFEVNGAPFNVSIRPRSLKAQSEDQTTDNVCEFSTATTEELFNAINGEDE